ncbi:TonB-dependent receptor plug domain-containing protein [Rubrivirga sp.]|uniref:TonB-dependent receptor plug domain-containing protein n=1 Tax=Rubrivirga sp. TaxID=1885344 RepID=UPI003B525FA4
MWSPRLVAAVLAVVLSAAARAQPVAPDTVRALGEVVVGEAEDRPGVERVPVAGILTRDPVALSDVARLVPSAAAPTNSRGEALLTVRGAGERQTAVLLDGAPLTVPWDRRIDLGLVPAGVVGAVDVVRGPASLAWGPNAAGGALDLVPRALASPGALTEAEVNGGLPARARTSATRLWASDGRSLSVAVDASAQAGDALAGPLPFSQEPGALRTNTDRRSAAVLARATAGGLAVTALHLSAAQGVAPEGHLDPAHDRVRFWRIPAQRQTALVARLRSGPVDATVWGALASQTIRPFRDASYDVAESEQRDRDRSAGGRALVTAGAGGVAVRALGTGLVSLHDRDGGDAADRFVTAEGRVGVEAETEGPVQALLGLAVDTFAPVETAGRESAGAFADWALTARLARDVGGVDLHGGVARAARFPTTRELFGEALGRFALNPDLRPESTWQAEVGVAARGPVAEGRAVVFGRVTTDTIEQTVLADGRRQRVNLGGSRAVGVEASGAVRRGLWRVDASGTLLHLRGEDGDGGRVRLPERPAALGRLAASVLPPTGWTVAAEVLATGPAVSLGPDGLIDLPASVVLAGRLGYRWAVGRGLLGAFARVDNATDALVLPQAGLPAPGREVRVGVRWVR